MLVNKLVIVDGVIGVLSYKKKIGGRWKGWVTKPAECGFQSGYYPMGELTLLKSKEQIPLDLRILKYLTGNYGSLNHSQEPHNIAMKEELLALAS